MRIYFGGTFDPVHIGHVQLALELAALFAQGKVYLMPCYKAVHKERVMASAAQRLAMLQLATEEYSNLIVDTRELEQDSPSYTYNSLCAIRQEIGTEPLVFVIGTDSLISFPLWYHSERLAELTNLIVIERPQASFTIGGTEAVSSHENARHYIERVLALGFEEITQPGLLEKYSAGKLISLKLSQFDVSSTRVRRLAHDKKPINHLVGDKVADYIKVTNLYQNQEA